MGTFISVVTAVIFLGILVNKLNKNSAPEVYKSNINYDGGDDSINESTDKTEEEINLQSNKCLDLETPKPDTHGLMLNVLNQLGCQPTANDDGTLSVRYQGENFHIEFGGMYARVWDPMWAGVKVDDPDLPNIREAVNAANYNFGPTVVMTNPDEEGFIGFHSRRDIMLHPACPDNVPFVKAVLDSFFDTKDTVRNHFQLINAKQVDEKKKRRPVGFATTN